jgi:hypothetical protein
LTLIKTSVKNFTLDKKMFFLYTIAAWILTAKCNS